MRGRGQCSETGAAAAATPTTPTAAGGGRAHPLARARIGGAAASPDSAAIAASGFDHNVMRPASGV